MNTKTVTTTILATATALTLTGCSLFGPTLQDRAQDAAVTINQAVDAHNQELADIDAQIADLQGQMDQAEKTANQAGTDTPELVQAREDAEAAYYEYDAAYSAYMDAELGSSQEAAWAQKVDETGAEYDAAEQKVYELENAAIDQYNQAQDNLNKTLKPLEAKQSALYDQQSDLTTGPILDMAFQVAVDCDLVGDPAGGTLGEQLKAADVTENCVTTLEHWADTL